MTIEDDIAFLERIPIFRRLGSGALRIVAIGAESYSVETGQVLFTVGEAGDGESPRRLDRAAHLALDVPAHARRLSGRRAAAARPARVADRSMGARDRECP